MLRMVSFALDYHWRQSSMTAEVMTAEVGSNTRVFDGPLRFTQVQMSDRERVTNSLPEDGYTLINYVAYSLYPPLYIAGPIITFNDFVWQVCEVICAVPVYDQSDPVSSYAVLLAYAGATNCLTSSALYSAFSRWKVCSTPYTSLPSRIRPLGQATDQWTSA